VHGGQFKSLATSHRPLTTKMFTITHPAMLLLFWLLPLVAGLLVYSHFKRAAAARRFVDREMLARLMPPETNGRAWLKGILLIAGLAMLIFALAGPRYGSYIEKVAPRGVDCFVCLDVSRSMLAEDVKPNRLERAKADILDLLKKLAGDRVGLIVFAGKAVVKAPLTTDDGFFRQSLEEVDVKSAPRGGTLIGDALRKAMESMPPRADADQAIVLITDGEDQESMPEEAAKNAAERGIKIFTVGLGDAGEGARIPIVDSAGGRIYIQDEKGEHWSKVDQNLLKKIALDSGGAYIPAGTRAYDLGQVYEEHLAGLARGEEAKTQLRKREKEQYQIFLAFAVAILAIERSIPRCSRKNGKGGDPR
jgi:Ca-activated chloride channel homolog